MKVALWLRASASAIALIGIAAPAEAQDAQQPVASSIVAPKAQGDPSQTDEIVVTGLRRSLQAAAQVKKNADQIVDTVVAEDIGKLPDNNASEALARITGVQVNRFADEANQVLIRGLPNVATTVQGREIFTADGRSVAVQDFPADSLAALEVYKATTAVNLEGGIAGLVNVRLRRPFDFNGFAIAGGVRGTYNDQSRKFDPIGNILVSDRFQTGIGEIGALLNVSYTQAHYLNSVRYDGFRNTPDASNTVSPASAGTAFTFPQDIGIFYARGMRYRPSANGSLQWKPADNLEIYVDGLYQGFRGRSEDDFLGLPIRGGGRALTNVVVDPATNEAVGLSTTLVGTNGPSKNTSNINTDTYQGAFGAKWKTGRATLSTDLAYTDSTVKGSTVNFDTAFAVPVRLDALFNVGYGVDFKLPGFDTHNIANYNFRGLYQQRTNTKGQGWQWRFDGTLDTDIGFLPTLDWGFRYSNRKSYAEFGDRYAYQGNQNIPLSSVPGISQGRVIDAGFRGSNIEQVRDWFNVSRNGLLNNLPQLLTFVRANGATNYAGEQPPYDPIRRYDAREKVYSFYGEAKYLIDVGFPIDGVVGARVVNTVSNLAGTSLVSAGGVTTRVPVGGKSNYLDVLPDASFRARFTEKLQLRGSYTKSLSRPEFAQTNPSLVINQSTEGGVTGFTGSSGNANLQPVRSTNYDVSLEYYYSRTGSASVAAFQRDVVGFINTYRNVGVVDPIFGVIDVFRPENAGKGKIKGVEAAFQTFFDFLPGALSGLGVQVNGTYIDGKQQLPAVLGAVGATGKIPGVSDFSYNVIGLYEKGPLSARLAYNRRSKFVTNYTSGGASSFAAEYTKAISRLDFSASVTPIKWLTITADATNLLGTPFENYFRSPVYPRDVRYEARVYSLGARFRY